MSRRILVLTFYYEPDLCAGSFRVTPLVRSLRDLAGPEVEIDVVTTMPNRYASYQKQPPPLEERPRPGLRVRRVALPVHRSGMRDQAVSFLFFARGVKKLVQKESYDVVFASSSRLMTAYLASRVASAKGARLYLDIRDIFVENMEDVVPHGLFRLIRPWFEILERAASRRADRINLISPAFLDYFSNYPRENLTTYTNGIDEDFIFPEDETPSPRAKGGPVTVLYAGNIGEGQGLHEVLPPLAERLGKRARFQVIGDGGRRGQLATELARRRVRNVEWIAPVERKDLVARYRNADVLFLHLNDYPAFRRLLPSKLFEYAATGKPIWAGLCGYSRKFAEEEVGHCAIFSSGDVDEAMVAFQSLRLENRPRTEFIEKYRRRILDRAFAQNILSLLRPSA